MVARLESEAQTSANRWLHVGLLFARPLLAEPDQAETYSHRSFPKLGITDRSQLREMVPPMRALSSSE